jgi:hypothetical protein
MLWTKRVYLAFRAAYKKDMSPPHEEQRAYYSDTDGIDQELFETCDWRPEIWRQLSAAGVADFLDLLSAEEIDAWKRRTLRWYDGGESRYENPARYINKADALGFIEACPEGIASCGIYTPKT